MAYIEPNTTVKFLTGVPFDPDYENTMYFATIADQETYMLSKVSLTISKNSYQRKSKGVIKVGWVADTVSGGSVIKTLYNASYMMFKNDNFENKWFYAFVTNVEYINNNAVEVSYEIDVIQTWMFAWTFNQCLIEREHTATDVFGENTIPENLEHGPYREEIPQYTHQQTVYTNGKYNYTPAICLVTTFDRQGQYAPGGLIAGLNAMGDYFSGLFFYIFTTSTQDIADLNSTLETIAGDAAKADGVVALFMCPYNFSDTGQRNDPDYLTFVRNTTIDGYTPRNNKLFCYPYNMLYVDNCQGNSAEFRWEEFANKSTVMLDVWGNMSTNCSLYCKPINYKGITGENDEEAIELSGFPMCAWSNDAFKAWVAQNVATLAGSAFSVGASWVTMLANPIAGGIAEVNRIPELRNYQVGKSFAKGFGEGWDSSALQTAGTIGATMGLLGQVFDHKRKPPQSHGNSNGNIQYQNGLMTFLFRRKFIKQEYARIIDSFFDMYGYATHRVGTPNLAARPCYTYVKTVGASMDGAMPTSDCEKIQAIFNKGIRFWKTTATFGSFDPAVNDNRPT